MKLVGLLTSATRQWYAYSWCMGVPSSLRRQVYVRSHGRCEQCGTRLTADWQAHHRKPRRMGGRAKNRHVNTLANLVALCPDCHMKIESHRRWALDRGLLLHEHDNPETVPIIVMGRRRVLLGEVYMAVGVGTETG